MLTTHLHIVLSLRMCRAIIPLLQVPSCLCTRTTFLWDLHGEFIISKQNKFLRNELSALSESPHIVLLDGSSQHVLLHMLNLCHLQMLGH